MHRKVTPTALHRQVRWCAYVQQADRTAADGGQRPGFSWAAFCSLT